MQNKTHSPTWVLVADSSQAKIYRLVAFPKIEELFSFKHPESHLRNQDLISSAPGRSSQRSSGIQYSYEPELEPKDIEAAAFAVELDHFLTSAHTKKDFNHLYILADPSFLGLLRRHLNPEVRKTVVAEVAKELIHCKIEEIQDHLSKI